LSDQYVTVERRDSVALIQLDRPKMNALSEALLSQLWEAARSLTDDPPSAAVIWGGRRIFAAGADISEFIDPASGRPSPAVAAGVATGFRAALDAVAALEVPTIAAVNGYALGGGCELALACDFRVVAEDARFGQPEILLGIIPGGGGTQRLARLVGPARAKDLVLSGRQVAADEALSMGLVDRVVPPDAVLDSALEWAGQLGRGPARAMALAKRAVDDGLDRPLAEGLDLEASLFAEVFGTEDARIGIDSFLEHGPGKATFEGR
jgi:enoyl-CoA hydratase